jgi:hypothetical protein
MFIFIIVPEKVCFITSNIFSILLFHDNYALSQRSNVTVYDLVERENYATTLEEFQLQTSPVANDQTVHCPS